MVVSIRMKKVVVYLCLAVFLCVGCSQVLSKTGEAVTVIEVRKESILVENLNKEREEILIPSIVSNLIEKDKQYFIEYEHYKGKNKTLVSIEPTKNP
jgi:uncharacterized protein YcfL